mgnify:CR=1 FL=1
MPARLARTQWEVLELLQTRVPAIAWHPGRVALAVGDFPDVDQLAVAQQLADWIVFQSGGRVADGHALLRKFLSRARAEKPPEGAGRVLRVDHPDPEDLTVYDRYDIHTDTDPE